MQRNKERERIFSIMHELKNNNLEKFTRILYCEMC